MSTKYCKCGGKTDYSLEEPKFCSKCGSSFAVVRTIPSSAGRERSLKKTEPRNDAEEFQNILGEKEDWNLPVLDPASVTFQTDNNLKTTFQALAKGAGPQGRTIDFTEKQFASLKMEEKQIRDSKGES